MTTKPSNPCAFPSPEIRDANDCGVMAAEYGMSLRDWLAGQALAGDIASCGNESITVPKGASVEDALQADAQRRAAWCYRQADAMLAARGES